MDRVQGSGSEGLCTFIKLQLLAFGSMAQIDLTEGVFPILISSVDRLMGGQDLKLAKGYFASNLSRLLGDGWWGAAHRPLAACPRARGSVEGGGQTLADTAVRAFKLDEVLSYTTVAARGIRLAKLEVAAVGDGGWRRGTMSPVHLRWW
jgi:hypothetical protein